MSLDHNVKVDITLPDGATTGRLTRTGGTETLQPAYSCTASGSNAVPGSYSVADCLAATGTLFQLDRTTTPLTTDYLHFQGSLGTGAVSAAVPGTYTGVIRIEARRSTT